MMLAWSPPLSFEQPVWLWLCLLLPVLWITSIKSLSGLDPTRRFFAVAFRSLLVILITACLARVQYVQRNKNLTVMLVMDRSFSTEAMQADVEAYLQEATQNPPPEDQIGMIDFSRNPYLQQLPMKGYHIAPGRLPPMPTNDRTDIAAAIRLAQVSAP